MTIKKISNLFSDKEIFAFSGLISSLEEKENKGENVFSFSEELGRRQLTFQDIKEDLLAKPKEIANSVLDFESRLTSVIYVEYNLKYGKPALPTHFDGDTNDLIVNYQFSSNTEWDIGIDFDVYKMEDNSALVFNANENAHWRPHKTFKDGEFIKMIFFRFANVNNLTDYSELQKYWPMDDFFIDMRNFRDSLI